MKISVIIPAYNSSATLERCIASLKAQTLDDCEFIFIDDFSSDNTLEVLKKTAEEDSRFVILAQPHRTDQFQIRIRGINTANGEYVMFLDADDEFSPDACEKAYYTARNENVDIFCFGSKVISTANASKIEVSNTQKYLDSTSGFTGKISGIDSVRNFYFKPNKFGLPISLCLKAFRRTTLVKALKDVTSITPTRSGEDLLQLIIILLHTESIYIDSSFKLHRYNLGDGGTQLKLGSLTMSNFERSLTSKNSYMSLQKYFDEHSTPDVISKITLKHAHNTFISVCCGSFWYLKNEDLQEGFKKLYNTWGEEIYTTPFFYSPTNLMRFKHCVIQRLDKNDPLRSKLQKRFYKLFLSIPFYKSKLYFKILFWK